MDLKVISFSVPLVSLSALKTDFLYTKYTQGIFKLELCLLPNDNLAFGEN